MSPCSLSTPLPPNLIPPPSPPPPSPPPATARDTTHSGWGWGGGGHSIFSLFYIHYTVFYILYISYRCGPWSVLLKSLWNVNKYSSTKYCLTSKFVNIKCSVRVKENKQSWVCNTPIRQYHNYALYILMHIFIYSYFIIFIMSTYIHYIIYKFKNLVTEERNQPRRTK